MRGGAGLANCHRGSETVQDALSNGDGPAATRRAKSNENSIQESTHDNGCVDKFRTRGVLPFGFSYLARLFLSVFQGKIGGS